MGIDRGVPLYAFPERNCEFVDNSSNEWGKSTILNSAGVANYPATTYFHTVTFTKTAYSLLPPLHVTGAERHDGRPSIVQLSPVQTHTGFPAAESTHDHETRPYP